MQQFAARVVGLHERGDRLLTGQDGCVVTQGMMKPASQQACAHRRAATVQDRKERGGFFTGQSARKFEIAARGWIHEYILTRSIRTQGLNVCQTLGLGAGRITQ